MELMFGNLAFSLVVKVGGIALGLGVILWLGYKFASKHLKKRERKLAVRTLWFIWLAAVVLMAMSVVWNSGPRITVNDYSSSGPQYEDVEVRNLNPNTKTDDERVQENRDLINRNAIDGD